MPKIHSRYDLPPSVSQEVGGPSMALQDAKDECDINKIIARYQRTGSWSGSMAVPSVQPQFGDYSSSLSYQEAQNVLIAAQTAFDGLSSQLRKRFNNDPAQMLDFLEDVSNREEAIKLGLVCPPEPPPVVVIEPSGNGEK